MGIVIILLILIVLITGVLIFGGSSARKKEKIREKEVKEAQKRAKKEIQDKKSFKADQFRQTVLCRRRIHGAVLRHHSRLCQHPGTGQ